jgi:hypothetical protein
MVLDWGLAKVLDEDSDESADRVAPAAEQAPDKTLQGQALVPQLSIVSPPKPEFD